MQVLPAVAVFSIEGVEHEITRCDEPNSRDWLCSLGGGQRPMALYFRAAPRPNCRRSVEWTA